METESPDGPPDEVARETAGGATDAARPPAKPKATRLTAPEEADEIMRMIFEAAREAGDDDFFIPGISPDRQEG